MHRSGSGVHKVCSKSCHPMEVVRWWHRNASLPREAIRDSAGLTIRGDLFSVKLALALGALAYGFLVAA